MDKLLLSILNLSTLGRTMVVGVFKFKAAAKSLATPIWLVASDLFGVKPISKTKSSSMLKYVAAGVPIFA